MRNPSISVRTISRLAGCCLLVVLIAPQDSHSAAFGTTIEEPTPLLVPTTCSSPKLAGHPQFLVSPKGSAKYPFNGICTSPERPGAQLTYRLEGSWSPSETDPNKPNASESIEITGFEPFMPLRTPGGRIFMYWSGRCKQDPWLQPDRFNCRLMGVVIPEDLRQAVPDLLTLNFPKTENMIPPADRQQLSAQYARLNAPVAAGVNAQAKALVPSPEMFTITKPVWNEQVQQGQLLIKAVQPKVGMPPVTELEFKWLDAPPGQPYINVFPVNTPTLLQGFQVAQAVTRGNVGRWEVRARASGKADPGPWSYPVQFKLFLTQPTQSQTQVPPVQQTSPLPSASVVQPSPVPQTSPLPPSSVMQAPAPSTGTTQMKRSPSMIMPRGIDKTGGQEGNEAGEQPTEAEKKP